MPRSHPSPRNSPLIHAEPAAEEIHVAGLVVHSRPEQLGEAAAWLSALPGVEIHGQSDQGKLVVLLESPHARDILELIDSTRARPGILDAALIYHEVVPQDEEDTE